MRIFKDRTDYFGVNEDDLNDLNPFFPWEKKIKDMGLWSTIWETLKKKKEK